MLDFARVQSMSPAKQLKNLLLQTRASIPNGEFCGVGVIISDDWEKLPIAPLCTQVDIPNQDTLANQIAECSLYSNSCHDGFQIVSDQWQLIHRNQYFAPFPSIKYRELTSSQDNVGSRYIAARFGSLIEGVLCTGLLSERNGIVVFVEGILVD